MKNLFNKGLLFKEFNAIRLITIMMFLTIFIFKTFQIFNLVSDENLINDLMPSNVTQKDYYYLQGFYYVLQFDIFSGNNFDFFDKEATLFGFFIIMLVLITLLSFSQMYFDKKSQGTSISYMVPVAKGTIMLNKIISSVMAIMSAFLINTILIILIVIFHRDILSNVMILIILKWSIRNILAYILIYLVFMLIQSFSVNIIESILASLFIINMPFIGILFLKWLNSNLLISNTLLKILETYFFFMWPVNYIINDRFFLSGPNELFNNRLYQMDMEPFWINKVLILIILISIITLLTLYLYNNNSFENRRKIIFRESILLQLTMLFVSGFGFLAIGLRFTNGILYKFYLNPITLSALLFVVYIYFISARYIAKNISKKLKGADKNV